MIRRTGAVIFALVFVAAGAQAQVHTWGSRYFSFTQPCRIIDTRLAGGPLVNGVPRHFAVTGSLDFGFQGGSATGCGISHDAIAAMINFVAVNPSGPGNLRGVAYGDPIPATGSIINYQALNPPLNVANGLAFPVCGSIFCQYEISLQANGGSVDLVADVLGYFMPGAISSVRAGEGLTGGGNGQAEGVISLGVASNAIHTGLVTDESLTGLDIQNDSLGSQEIADQSLTADDLADNSVGTAEIQFGAVTRDKIAAPLALFTGRMRNVEIAGPTFFGTPSGMSGAGPASAVASSMANRPCIALNLSARVTSGATPSRSVMLYVNGSAVLACSMSGTNSCNSGAATAVVPANAELAIATTTPHALPLGITSDLLFGWECR